MSAAPHRCFDVVQRVKLDQASSLLRLRSGERSPTKAKSCEFFPALTGRQKGSLCWYENILVADFSHTISDSIVAQLDAKKHDETVWLADARADDLFYPAAER
ncbi:hypothetical protein [Thalassoglobus polymorphus]|uniref:Uncharacterized protein n=1 Tax=Thalassoglobus polymorphus TaxID=2527994 RepID=A0A517QJE3_9PLAN|nr:hypothetical protein [Thalassoglobus polymorphus]QDT31738.1 hypothetical protein Mal48_09740 [Thalassoglobus polymorphus]